ncbi:S-layer homology domain-containing protein [Evtepia gabavorous]|uniref:S-layer homology domain-containing protein n=1 Tax=Evtepia gabavorous TaxID=2211183 RepID=UPI003A95548B
MRDKEFPQKKVLSLVLCVAVMLSVMVMGAGAAFSDQDKIENTEAVDACVALNIIGGYPDGSYKPEGNIKRSEITKMICVALNGGKEPNVSTNSKPTFNDVRGTNAAWAEGYIEACVAQGIVSGVGGGRFSPNGNVTGTQLAKMLLVCLGYDAGIEGFVGSAWETNVNVRAAQKGLYEGLESMDTAAALTRDNAAQMVWNAMNAYEVEYKTTIVTDENGNLITQNVAEDKQAIGEDNKLVRVTLLGDKYEASVYEGILVASGEYGIQSASAGKDKLKLQVKAINGAAVSTTTPEATFKYANDITDLMGQYIKVLVDDKTNAYGVFPVADQNVVASATFDKVKIDGTKISVDGTAYNYNDVVIEGIKKDSSNDLKISELTGTKAEVASGDVITFISNDGDSKIDLAIVNPMKSASSSLDKVTYVSKTEFVAGGNSYEFDNVIAPNDLAKGDYVAYYENTYTGDKEFIKADKVSGKVTSTKDSGKEVKIGDNWYKVGNTTPDSPFYQALMKKGDAVELNSTVTAYVVNGVIYYANAETAGSTDTALVLAAPGSMDTNGNYQVKLLFSDKTTKVVPADQKYTGLEGKLVTWEVSDDVYELEAVSAVNKAGGDVYAESKTGFEKADKTLADKKVASDAVIYVTYKDGTKDKETVLSGNELNGLGGDLNGSVYYVLTDGLISLAYIDSNSYLPGANATQLYGYVVSSVSENNDNNVKYKQYDVYTTDGKLVEGVKQKATTSVKKGDFIKLSLSSDNYAEGVAVLNIDDNAGALLNYSSDYISLVKSDGTAANINLDDNVKYLVVNTKDVKGVGNEADLEKASETGVANKYFANVSYYAESGSSDAVLVVIDTTGKWYKNGESSATEVTQNAATAPTSMAVSSATSHGMTVNDGAITDGKTVAVTDYSSSKNMFKVSMTPAINTTATMTLEGDILEAPVVLTGSTTSPVNKDDIKVTGKGTIDGKITVEESGKATTTISFTITIQ